YWRRINGSTVALWRKALGGEGRDETEGARRLVQAGQRRRVAKLRDKPRSPAQVERRRQTARALDRALTDAELLERFLVRREEAAFALLVQRHGPLAQGTRGSPRLFAGRHGPGRRRARPRALA